MDKLDGLIPAEFLRKKSVGRGGWNKGIFYELLGRIRERIKLISVKGFGFSNSRKRQ
jgi:hypothetical protein